jgi:hypothetical protein
MPPAPAPNPISPGKLPDTHVAFPTRYASLQDDLRKKYGTLADKVASHFFQVDPTADRLNELLSTAQGESKRALWRMRDLALEHGIDAVENPPAPLRAFFEQVEDVPIWLDWERLDLGCRTHLRCGLICGVVLACCSLPLAYRAAGGNKPLMASGELVKRAPKRMSETNNFYLATCMPGSMRPHAAGWKNTVLVRLRHANMRRWLAHPELHWSTAEYGAPINQLDLAATCLLFSANLLQSLRRIGFHFSTAESEAVMHLWRYSGYLLGVGPDLLCASEAEGRRLSEILLDVAGAPDADSVELTRALMTTAMPELISAALPWLVPAPGSRRRFIDWVYRLVGIPDRRAFFKRHFAQVCYGLSNAILGDRVKSELHYPNTFWSRTAPWALRSFLVPFEVCRRLVPGGNSLAVWLGRRRLQRLMKNKMFARSIPT